jgi:hypothetical protein
MMSTIGFIDPPIVFFSWDDEPTKSRPVLRLVRGAKRGQLRAPRAAHSQKAKVLKFRDRCKTKHQG